MKKIMVIIVSFISLHALYASVCVYPIESRGISVGNCIGLLVPQQTQNVLAPLDGIRETRALLHQVRRYSASMETAKRREEETVCEVLSKYRTQLGHVSIDNIILSDPRRTYDMCFARGVVNEDWGLQVTRDLLREGIVPRSFFTALQRKYLPAARLLCEFWDNRDLYAHLICVATQNTNRWFHFLNYLLFEEHPRSEQILKCLSKTEDPFSVYESMFPKILAEAGKDNPRCMEHLFFLRFESMMDPYHYGKYWGKVQSNQALTNRIIQRQLSVYREKGIDASAEYFGF